MNDRVYYTVEVPYTVAATPIDKEYWVLFAGENTGISDWWNDLPRRYSSYDEAIKAIESSDNFRDRKWRIVKTTVYNEVVGTYS
jgi:hypothetical protein